jgi:hypothetical protein
MTAPAIRLQGLKKNFGASEIIRGVDLDIHRGERHAIIGPNGAGKSTLFHLISARLPLTSGTIAAQGRERHRAEALRDQPQGAVAQLPDHQHLPQPLGVREPALRRAVVAGLPLFLLADGGRAQARRAPPHRSGDGADIGLGKRRDTCPACSRMPNSARWKSASPSPAAPT